MFTFIIEGVFLSIVSLLGVLGNVVAIFILSKPVMKGSFSTLLIGILAITWSLYKKYSKKSNTIQEYIYISLLIFKYRFVLVWHVVSDHWNQHFWTSGNIQMVWKRNIRLYHAIRIRTWSHRKGWLRVCNSFRNNRKVLCDCTSLKAFSRQKIPSLSAQSDRSSLQHSKVFWVWDQGTNNI